MPYKSWPQRIERSEQTLLHLAADGKMWSLTFQRFGEGGSFYDVHCEGVEVTKSLRIEHLGACDDFATTPKDVILAMNLPCTFYFFSKRSAVCSTIQPHGIPDNERQDWIPMIGNYGTNALLVIRNLALGPVQVAQVYGQELYSYDWQSLLQEDGTPWRIDLKDDLIPIINAPGKRGALAHVTEKGTAFYSLDPFYVTHQYTKYMLNNPMFYNVQKHKRDLKGGAVRRISYSGWTALLDLPKDSYLMKLDAEDIAKPYEGEWISVEVDGAPVPLGKEFTVTADKESEMTFTALQTLTDIVIRCEQPVLLSDGSNIPRSVIYLKCLMKDKSVTLKKAALEYDTFADSESRRAYFHISVTAEVWATDYDWIKPCCLNMKYCCVCS